MLNALSKLKWAFYRSGNREGNQYKLLCCPGKANWSIKINGFLAIGLGGAGLCMGRAHPLSFEWTVTCQGVQLHIDRGNRPDKFSLFPPKGLHDRFCLQSETLNQEWPRCLGWCRWKARATKPCWSASLGRISKFHIQWEILLEKNNVESNQGRH